MIPGEWEYPLNASRWGPEKFMRVACMTVAARANSQRAILLRLVLRTLLFRSSFSRDVSKMLREPVSALMGASRLLEL